MAFDPHSNFAYGTVATAPSPASSGTTLSVGAGQGALFPAAPFNVTVWPVNAIPLSTNAEIVRVTNKGTGDNWTITRTQESSSARSIVVGDQIANTVTAKLFTDLETLFPHDIISQHSYSGGAALDVFGLSAASTIARLTPSNNPGAVAKIMVTNASGGFTFGGLTVINTNAAAAPAVWLAGTTLQITPPDATNGALEINTFGTSAIYSGVVMRHARNTLASLSAVQSGDVLGSFQGVGYGSTGWSAAGRASWSFVAAETWSDTAQGAYIDFNTTPTGGTSTAAAFYIYGDGSARAVGPVLSRPIGTTAGVQLDHNSATGNFILSLSPANLTANRRITFPDADGTAVYTSRTISVSGTGLSGGGDLSANRTITLTSSSNPGAAAKILATDSSGSVTLTGLVMASTLFINNAVLLEWLDSGGTGRGVLQMFSDNNVYLDSIASGGKTIFRNGAGYGVTLTLDSSQNAQFAGGVEVGSATGGLKGAGTINCAADIYKNGGAYTNPAYALEHWATGQIVKHADKAGAKDYRRLTLGEVEDYVRRHYELPGHRDGFGLFGGGDWLLEKLEEAFVHLIEMDKRVAELERGN